MPSTRQDLDDLIAAEETSPPTDQDEEAVDSSRESKRAKRRRPEAKPGMPKVYRRSHNLEVAVAPAVNAFKAGVGPVNSDLQSFMHEQLYGTGTKRIASASFSSMRRAGAGQPVDAACQRKPHMAVAWPWQAQRPILRLQRRRPQRPANRRRIRLAPTPR